MCSGTNFFEITITAVVYHDIIQQFIVLLHKDKSDAVFQQDNVQPLVAKDMMFFSTEFLGSKFAST